MSWQLTAIRGRTRTLRPREWRRRPAGGAAISRRGTVLPASWTSPQVNLARGAAAAAAASRTRGDLATGIGYLGAESLMCWQ
jgi:hypothetical protein